MCYTATQVTKSYDLQNYFKANIPKPEQFEIHEQLYKADGFTHPKLIVLKDEEGSRALELMQWGLLPFWNKPYADMLKISHGTLNAKSETVRTLASFKNSITNKRCIIPVNSFFEYKHEDGDKLPYLIHPKEQPYFNLAGIYSYYKNPESKEIITSFSIITQPANVFMADIHNSAKRMPMMLSSNLISDWLNPNTDPAQVDEIMRYSCDDSSLSAYRVLRDLKKAPNDERVLKAIE